MTTLSLHSYIFPPYLPDLRPNTDLDRSEGGKDCIIEGTGGFFLPIVHASCRRFPLPPFSLPSFASWLVVQEQDEHSTRYYSCSLSVALIDSPTNVYTYTYLEENCNAIVAFSDIPTPSRTLRNK